MSRRIDHGIIERELENHLEGSASRAFYEHLGACPDCTSAIAALDDISLRVRGLRAETYDVPSVSPGFYSRVAARIVDTQRQGLLGRLFSPGEAFFRRVAFTSLLLLAGLGAFLASQPAADNDRDAAAIIAQHDPTSNHVESADRGRLLVTLTSYPQ
ncbi:MAG: hypothetical protein KGN84_22745 [Acidobacteriota bacterium]|nr:hypothetical protein [Acidobacteriota bacterium]